MTTFSWELVIFGALLIVVGLLILKGRPDFRPKGVIHVRRSEEKDTYLFEFNIPPEQIPSMKAITFRVAVEEDHSQNIQSS